MRDTTFDPYTHFADDFGADLVTDADAEAAELVDLDQPLRPPLYAGPDDEVVDLSEPLRPPQW